MGKLSGTRRGYFSTWMCLLRIRLEFTFTQQFSPFMPSVVKSQHLYHLKKIHQFINRHRRAFYLALIDLQLAEVTRAALLNLSFLSCHPLSVYRRCCFGRIVIILICRYFFSYFVQGTKEYNVLLQFHFRVHLIRINNLK